MSTPVRPRSSPTCGLRATDENIKLEPPRELTLELALEFIEDDELIEVTPGRIGLRKRHLDPIARKRAARKKA